MTVEDDRFTQMVASDDVRERGVGVIARFLRERTTLSDPEADAHDLIVATGQAGLVTVIRDDLDQYLDTIKRRRVTRTFPDTEDGIRALAGELRDVAGRAGTDPWKAVAAHLIRGW